MAYQIENLTDGATGGASFADERMTRFVAAALLSALSLIGCAATPLDSNFESSRFDDIAMAARYASECGTTQSSEAYARIEIVNFEAGLYKSAIFLSAPDGDTASILIQRGCRSEPTSVHLPSSDVQTLLRESVGLTGDFFVGRMYSDGTTYFVRSKTHRINLAVYEPCRGSVGASVEDLEKLRAWAAYAESIL